MKVHKVFPSSDLKKKAEDYHGGCAYERTLPAVSIHSANIEVTFEEALKLSLALASCLQNLNRLNRKNAAGKSMGVVLSVKTGNKSISVLEKKIKTNMSSRSPS